MIGGVGLHLDHAPNVMQLLLEQEKWQALGMVLIHFQDLREGVSTEQYNDAAGAETEENYY